MNSPVSPHEVNRLRIDTTLGTLEVNHLYGYHDAGWTWTPLADRPGETGMAEDPWGDSAGEDLPSGHLAQITRLVDDLLACRPHKTPLASTRPTLELITAMYASALLGRRLDRPELTPAHPFYTDLAGGLPMPIIRERIAVARG